jgi:uncharacterized RDD family membrane protein YckC
MSNDTTLPIQARLRYSTVSMLARPEANAPALGELHGTDQFTVVDAAGEYYLVRRADGVEGFIFAGNIAVVGPVPGAPGAAPPISIDLTAARSARVLAHLLDGLIVGVAGLGLLLVLGMLQLPAEVIGPPVALALYLAYYTLGDSALLQGQTKGKQVFGIAVVGAAGGYLSLPHALARNLPVMFLWFNSLLWALLPSSITANAALSAGYALGVFILFLGVYVLPLLAPGRRGVHDLVAGALVVDQGRWDELAVDARPSHVEGIAWGHSLAVISAVVVVALGLIVGGQAVGRAIGVDELQPVLAALGSVDGATVTNVSIQRGPVGSTAQRAQLVIRARVDAPTFQDPERLRVLDATLKQRAARSYAQIDTIALVMVQFETGASAGLASVTQTRSLGGSTPQEILGQPAYTAAPEGI